MGILGLIARGALSIAGTTSEKYVNDVKNAALDTLTDTIESMLAGKRTFDDWAELVEPNVDGVVNRVCNEDGLTYVGGKLKFCFCDSTMKKIYIAYELYFVDDEKRWQKVEAKSDVYANTFTDACLTELREKREIAYEVTK